MGRGAVEKGGSAIPQNDAVQRAGVGGTKYLFPLAGRIGGRGQLFYGCGLSAARPALYKVCIAPEILPRGVAEKRDEAPRRVCAEEKAQRLFSINIICLPVGEVMTLYASPAPAVKERTYGEQMLPIGPERGKMRKRCGGKTII